MIYPMASGLYYNGDLAAESNDIRLLESLHIVKSPRGSDFHGQIIHVMQTCLKRYGDKFPANDPTESLLINSSSAFYPYYNASNGSEKEGSYNDTFWSVDNFALIDDVCDIQQVGLNADIGGIGVRQTRLL